MGVTCPTSFSSWVVHIIDVADHLFGMLSDYSYISLRNCVYENIVRHECSKTELYYQSVFKNNVKEILGEEYEIIKNHQIIKISLMHGFLIVEKLYQLK